MWVCELDHYRVLPSFTEFYRVVLFGHPVSATVIRTSLFLFVFFFFANFPPPCDGIEETRRPMEKRNFHRLECRIESNEEMSFVDETRVGQFKRGPAKWQVMRFGGRPFVNRKG